jgi:hypothetical protein
MTACQPSQCKVDQLGDGFGPWPTLGRQWRRAAGLKSKCVTEDISPAAILGAQLGTIPVDDGGGLGQVGSDKYGMRGRTYSRLTGRPGASSRSSRKCGA